MVNVSPVRHIGGARFPNTTNFRRATRLSIVGRMRAYVAGGIYEDIPRWLSWCERTPPYDLKQMKLQDRKVRNPYPAMIKVLLAKYPDLRFQDCFVDGNDWSYGNDRYRDDHPVMQFVARQLTKLRTKF